jgi:hypothetical protein
MSAEIINEFQSLFNCLNSSTTNNLINDKWDKVFPGWLAMSWMLSVVGTGIDAWFTLTMHQQTLTTMPFRNTCEAYEVSHEVEIGGLQDTCVYNQRKCNIF